MKLTTRIQEAGGFSNIKDPVEEVIVPHAEEYVEGRGVTSLERKAREEGRPEIVPSPVTFENLVKRLVFEKKVREHRDKYEELTGENIELNWTKIGTPITG